MYVAGTLVSGGGLNEGPGEGVASTVICASVWVAVGGKVVNVATGVLRMAVASCWIVAVGDSSSQI